MGPGKSWRVRPCQPGRSATSSSSESTQSHPFFCLLCCDFGSNALLVMMDDSEAFTDTEDLTDMVWLFYFAVRGYKPLTLIF